MERILGKCVVTRKLACILTGLFMLSAVSHDGRLTYRTTSKAFDVPLKYVYYVSGSDIFDAKKTIRRLLFTSKPLDARIQSCASMRCVDPEMEGIQVDLDAAPRLLYWLALNGGQVQYSGTAKTEELVLKTDTSDKLVGELHIDDSLAGGAKLDVSFDVARLKTFTKTE